MGLQYHHEEKHHMVEFLRFLAKSSKIGGHRVRQQNYSERERMLILLNGVLYSECLSIAV